jgi:hypothetical protein
MGYTKQFEEEEEENTGNNSSNNSEYVFEGFTIELNEKIMLTPVQIK